jgi:predicted nuclease of restriction endonuclease-like (RecB) superfamily
MVQFKTALLERTVLSPPKVSALLTQLHTESANLFRDAYMLEFLGLPDTHAETDLHAGLVQDLRTF